MGLEPTNRRATTSSLSPEMVAPESIRASTFDVVLAVASDAPTEPAPIETPFASARVSGVASAVTLTSSCATTSAPLPMVADTPEVTSAVATAPDPETMPAAPAVALADATEPSLAKIVTSLTSLPAVLPTSTLGWK
ncbi:hypothetical protein D9M68_889300 [compost metagenome]